MQNINTLDDLLLYSVIVGKKNGEAVFDDIIGSYQKALEQDNMAMINGIEYDYKNLVDKLISNTNFKIPEDLTEKQKEHCQKLIELRDFKKLTDSNNLSLQEQELVGIAIPILKKIPVQKSNDRILDSVQARECIDYPKELASLRGEIKSHIEKDPALQLQLGVLLISGKKASGQEWEKEFIDLVNKNKDFLEKTPPAITIALAENMKKLGDEITADPQWKRAFLVLITPIIKALSKIGIVSKQTKTSHTNKLDARAALKGVEKLAQQRLKSSNKGIGVA